MLNAFFFQYRLLWFLCTFVHFVSIEHLQLDLIIVPLLYELEQMHNTKLDNGSKTNFEVILLYMCYMGPFLKSGPIIKLNLILLPCIM